MSVYDLQDPSARVGLRDTHSRCYGMYMSSEDSYYELYRDALLVIHCADKC